MSKGHWRVGPPGSTAWMASVSVADDVDRFDEAAHVRVGNSPPMPSRVQLARTSAAVTGVPSEKRAFSRSVTIQRRLLSSSRQDVARPGPTRAHAVDPDQRLVQLTEEQSLAVVRRVGCVGWIDALGEADGRDRFPWLGDQRAFIDGRTRQRVSDRSRFWLRGDSRSARGVWLLICLRGRWPRRGSACAARPGHRLQAGDESERGVPSSNQPHVLRS